MASSYLEIEEFEEREIGCKVVQEGVFDDIIVGVFRIADERDVEETKPREA